MKTWIRGLAGAVAILLMSSPALPEWQRDPAREVRNNDMAFALTMEALRRVQGSLIERDYESRLEAASRVRRPDVQTTIQALAEMERYLRTRRLHVQMQHLNTAYAYVRRHDEDAAGIRVASNVDLDKAGQMLDTFVPIANVDPSTPVFDPGKPLAASRIVADDNFVSPLARLATPKCAWCDAYAGHLALLSIVAGASNDVTASAATLIGRQLAGVTSSIEEPALLMLSYRRNQGKVDALVAQVFDQTAEPVAGSHRVATHRLEGFDDLADRWFGLANNARRTWFGPAQEVRQRQHAFEQMLLADLTFMREQSVEPLHVVITMPHPDVFLPSCLRGKVAGAVVELELTVATWRKHVRLLTADHEAAQQVAQILAAWRELVGMAGVAYTDQDTYQKSRESLRQSSIEAGDKEVALTGSIASNLGVRAVAKVMRWGFGEAAP